MCHETNNETKEAASLGFTVDFIGIANALVMGVPFIFHSLESAMRGYRTNYANLDKTKCFRDTEKGTVTTLRFDHKKGHHVYKTKTVKKCTRIVTLMVGIRDDEADLGIHKFSDGTLKSTADFQNCQKFLFDMMLPEMMRDDKRNITISVPTSFNDEYDFQKETWENEIVVKNVSGLCEDRGYRLIVKRGESYRVPPMRFG